MDQNASDNEKRGDDNSRYGYNAILKARQANWDGDRLHQSSEPAYLEVKKRSGGTTLTKPTTLHQSITTASHKSSLHLDKRGVPFLPGKQISFRIF